MRTSRQFTKKAVAVVLGVAVVAMISAIALGGCGAAVEAQQGTDLSGTSASLVNVINVTGTGTITTLPDKATIQVSVQDDASTAAAALDANSKDMQKVLARLKTEGVADKDIETASVTVYPNMYYDQTSGQQKQQGYRAENSVTVTFHDLSKIGTVYAAVVDAGADNVYGPNWMLSDDNPAVATALTRAIANARFKAEAIAADQGVQLGDAIIISEASATTPYPIYEKATAGAGTADSTVTPPPISPQSMDVSASVTVTYRMTR